MDQRPTYEELVKIRDRLEKRIAELEKDLGKTNVQAGFLDDSGFFAELFQKAADMIIMSESGPEGKTGKILMANQAALINLEYSLGEIQKLTLDDLTTGTSKATKTDTRYPETHKYERTFRSRSGKTFHTEVYSHLITYGTDKYVFAIIRDIGEHKELEESLRRSEEKYRRLVESLSDEFIFYSHDTSGMITYLSPSITRVLGYSLDEAMRNFRDFLSDHEMNQEALRASLESLKGNIQPPFMNELYHRDGSTRIFNNTELPIYNENGEVVGVEGIAQNITDRINAEKELKEQQEIFKLLVETIEEVFWIHDMKEDRLIYVSPKYREVYGRSTNSLYHNPGSFLKAVHPEDADFVKSEYRKISKGKGLDLEYRIMGPENKVKIIWSRSFVLLDSRKRPSISIGTSLDITERKKSQQEKDLLAAIVENLEDHAVIKDTSLRIIASNLSNTRAAGFKSADQLIGKTDMEVYGDYDHVRQYMEDDRKALKLKKGETLVNDQVFVYPDGRKIHSLVKKFPVFDKKNQLIAVAAISRDVTDYKNTLEELYRSEEKYRLLIQNQGEGIGMVDKEDVFMFANPKAEEIFGVPEGKLVGKSLFEFVDQKNREQIEEQTLRRMDGLKDTYELEIQRAGGQKRRILVTANPQYDYDGEFAGTFAVFRDVTEWRKKEEKLKEDVRKLKETNASKDRFFSIIAHDLKNPFNSILGCSDLLLMDYENYDQEEILTLIKMIHDASRQAHNLLENLLNWTRAQTGRLPNEPTAIDVRGTIDEVFQLYQGNANEKNQTLINKVRSGTLAFGDPNMVQTILRNLVSNAIKFTRPRGKVTVSARKNGNECEIQVIDNGIGIPEEIMQKLFRIDEKVTRTGTANEEGTGLGLALSMDFAQRNNGTIKVSSKPGKGSTFSVLLPRHLNPDSTS
jgi:PAS domain S-box-containing protein